MRKTRQEELLGRNTPAQMTVLRKESFQTLCR